MKQCWILYVNFICSNANITINAFPTPQTRRQKNISKETGFALIFVLKFMVLTSLIVLLFGISQSLFVIFCHFCICLCNLFLAVSDGLTVFVLSLTSLSCLWPSLCPVSDRPCPVSPVSVLSLTVSLTSLSCLWPFSDLSLTVMSCLWPSLSCLWPSLSCLWRSLSCLWSSMSCLWWSLSCLWRSLVRLSVSVLSVLFAYFIGTSCISF